MDGLSTEDKQALRDGLALEVLLDIRDLLTTPRLSGNRSGAGYGADIVLCDMTPVSNVETKRNTSTDDELCCSDDCVYRDGICDKHGK